MDIIRIFQIIFVSTICCATVLGQSAAKSNGDSGDGKSWSKDKYEEDASQTFDYLFYKYNPRSRPPTQHVNVTVEMTLLHIRRFDIMRRELELVVGLDMSWMDSRLEWIPNRVYQVMTNVSSVWTPDIVLFNSVYPNLPLFPPIVLIESNGKVAWTTRQVITTSCDTRLGSAEQTCHLHLGFMSNLIKLQEDRFIDGDTSRIITSDDFRNHEWEMEYLGFDFGEKNEDVNTTSLPNEMNVELTLRHKKNDKRGSGDPASVKSNLDCCNKNSASGRYSSCFSIGIYLSIAVIQFSFVRFILKMYV